MDRRELLVGAGLGLACFQTPGSCLAATPEKPRQGGLQAHAAAKGLNFGSAINITSLRRDPLYGPIIAADCGVGVAENEMKMEYAWPAPGRFDYRGGDEILAFTQKNGLKLRGTTLIWRRGMPDWAQKQAPRDAERLMRRWISAIAGRYRGQIESWDVVNEIVDYRSANYLRRTLWLEALGPDYIPLAFHLLQEADPAAAGLWNEEDVELDVGWMDQRRACVLKILDDLLARKTPIKRFGVQSHLNSLIPLNQTKLRKFLAEVASRGLAIEITELDIDDRAFPANIAARDAGVAELAKNYLDVVLDEPAVLNVLTWDLLDANTWYNTSARRRLDGLPQRSLIYDRNHQPKPIWKAVRQALDDAPDHAERRLTLRRR